MLRFLRKKGLRASARIASGSGHAAEGLESRLLLSVNIVADINATLLSKSPPSDMVDVGGTLFFVDNDGVHGAELWKSDGTEAGTVMVKDIRPGAIGSSPVSLTNIDGTLYFSANDGVHGVGEIWRSDGTDAGTVLVGDVPFSNSIFGFTPIGNTIYFFANNNVGLWKTDGTTLTKIKSVNDQNAEFPSDPVVMGGKLYFIDGGTTAGGELWASDGTATGTAPVKAVLGTYPLSNLTVLGNELLFTAGNNQLWASDGTAAGTTKIATVVGTGMSNFTLVGNQEFFTAAGSFGTTLWVTDGSTARQIPSVDVSAAAAPLAAMGGRLYFAELDQLWTSDGTAAGTYLVADISRPFVESFPGNLAAIGNTLYFAGNGGSGLAGVWKSDGTAAGTMLVKPLAGYSSYPPASFVASGPAIFFVGNDGATGAELWRTDGTSAGTALVKDIDHTTSTSNPRFIGTYNGRLYFFANDGIHGAQPWYTDGTAAGTGLLTVINPRGNAIGIGVIGVPPGFVAGGYLYFTANDGTSSPLGNYQLWRTDGTDAGTIKLLTYGSPINSWATLNNRLYFTLESNPGIWSSDGTVAGTTKVVPSTIQYLGLGPAMNGKLFCIGDGEIWTTDGTAAGTTVMEDLAPNATGLTVVGNTLYFFAGNFPSEALYKSDGTGAGTVLVKNVNWSGDGEGAVGGKFYFAGGQGTAAGEELWVSDGTPDGTHMVADINPSGDSRPGNFADLNGILLFWASNAALQAEELYRSDGTAAGTYLVKAIYPQWNDMPDTNSWPRIGDDYYLVTGAPGAPALWKTDGTAAGTIMVTGVQPGTTSFLGQMAAVGDSLLFTADDNIHGEEVWRASTEYITGSVFNDLNHDGVDQPAEPGQAGVTVYLDANNNGVLDPGEETAVTDSSGTYLFTDLTPGTFTVREVVPTGWARTTPLAAALPLTVAPGQTSVAGPMGNVQVSTVPMDFSYLLTLAQHYGQEGTFATGDLNGDDQVNFDDLLILAQNYGHALPSAAATNLVAAAAPLAVKRPAKRLRIVRT